MAREFADRRDAGRRLAARAGRPVVELARSHTTVSVERAVLRLAGVTGADSDGIPWVNRLVDAVRADVGLGHGVAVPVFHALRRRFSRERPAPAAAPGSAPADPERPADRPERRS